VEKWNGIAALGTRVYAAPEDAAQLLVVETGCAVPLVAGARAPACAQKRQSETACFPAREALPKRHALELASSPAGGARRALAGPGPAGGSRAAGKPQLGVRREEGWLAARCAEGGSIHAGELCTPSAQTGGTAWRQQRSAPRASARQCADGEPALDVSGTPVASVTCAAGDALEFACWRPGLVLELRVGGAAAAALHGVRRSAPDAKRASVGRFRVVSCCFCDLFGRCTTSAAWRAAPAGLGT